MSMPGFDRAQAAYEAQEPDDAAAEDCPDTDCGQCLGCRDAVYEDDREAAAEAAREDARLGL